jgi:hypothetical protein
MGTGDTIFLTGCWFHFMITHPTMDLFSVHKITVNLTKQEWVTAQVGPGEGQQWCWAWTTSTHLSWTPHLHSPQDAHNISCPGCTHGLAPNLRDSISIINNWSSPEDPQVWPQLRTPNLKSKWGAVHLTGEEAAVLDGFGAFYFDREIFQRHKATQPGCQALSTLPTFRCGHYLIIGLVAFSSPETQSGQTPR